MEPAPTIFRYTFSLAIVNENMYGAEAFAERAKCRVYRVGDSVSSDMQIERIVATQSGVNFFANGVAGHLDLHGEYNAWNAGLAVAVADVFNVETFVALKSIEEVKAEGLRMMIKSAKGITWLWDCFNANPVSMRAALGVLTQDKSSRLGVVFGGMGELGASAEAQHKEIAKLIADLDVAWIVAVGEFSDSVARVAKENGVEFSVCVETIDDGIDFVNDYALLGDRVLVKGSHVVHLEKLMALINMEAG